LSPWNPVAGISGWPAGARAFELNQALVLDEAGVAYLTPEMAQRVRFSEGVERVNVENLQE
jgi:hypothetical protein